MYGQAYQLYFFHSDKIAPLVFCLFLLKANLANIVVHSIVINSRRFLLNDFNEELAIQLGITTADFANEKLLKRWEKITFGTHFTVAPAYFIPTDQQRDREIEHAEIDVQLSGAAYLSEL